MYSSTVCTAGNFYTLTLHITNNTANIAYDKIFIATLTYTFHNKSFAIMCAGSHNIAAVVNSFINSTITAKVTYYTADIMRTAYFVFAVSCISNICINSTANNAAYITGSIIFIIISLVIYIFCIITFAAAYIASISYIFYCTTVRRTTGNTTNVSNIYIYRNNTVIKRDASRKLVYIRYICMIIIFIC